MNLPPERLHFVDATLENPQSNRLELAKRPSIFWRLTSWLWPTRPDGLMILSFSLVLIGLLDPIIEKQAFFHRSVQSYGTIWFAIAGIAGAMLGVAASFGWKNCQPGSARVVLIAAILTALAFVYSSHLAWSNQITVSLFFGRHEVHPIMLDEDAIPFWFSFLVGILAASGVVFFFTRGVLLVTQRAQAKSKRWVFSRTKLMIVFALILLVVGTIQNIFFPRGFLSEANFSIAPGLTETFVFQIAMFLIAFVMLCIVSWIFSTGDRRVWKYVVLCLICLVSFFAAMFYAGSNNLTRQHEFQQILAFVAGLNVFLWTTIAVGGGSSSLSMPADNTTSAIGYSRRQWPSVWVLLMGLFTLFFAAIIAFFDPIPLIQTFGRDWETARFARIISSDSNGQVRVATGIWGFYELSCDFDEGVDPGVFGKNQIPGLAIASIENMVPEIETEVFDGMFQQVVIGNSKVSTQQLGHLLKSPAFVTLTNVEVVNPTPSLDLVSSMLVIEFKDGHSPISLLQSIKSADDALLTLKVSKDSLNKEALDEIVRFSQRIPVTVNDNILQYMVETNYSTDSPMNNLFIGLGTNQLAKNNDPLKRFVLENEISLIFNGREVSGLVWHQQVPADAFWDLAFAKGKSGVPFYSDQVAWLDSIRDESFQEKAKRYGWQFGENQNGDPTHLFLPEGESDFERSSLSSGFLGAVETLCFDPGWLSGTDPNLKRGWRAQQFGYATPASLTGLAKLPKLKRLVISPRVAIDNPDILKTIPSIEHLQIRLADAILLSVDFSVCKKLKTLVYFGTPAKSTMKNLAKLKKLESLTVVNLDDGTLNSPQAITNLKSLLPGVKVEVVPFKTFEAKPTQRFQQHVKDQAKVARRRLGIADPE